MDMDIQDIRLANAHHVLRERCGGNKSEMARQLQKEPQTISKWFTSSSDRRNIGKSSARLIERMFGLPTHWMESIHENNNDLEPNTQRRTELKLNNGESYYPSLRQSAAIDQNLRLTLLDDREGSLMILSTDENAYALQLIGHNPTFFLGSGWVILVEPSTPLAQDECALLLLDSGELLLRLIVHIGDDMLIVRNPATGVQDNIPRSRVVRAEYAYIGFPPTKVKINKQPV